MGNRYALTYVFGARTWAARGLSPKAVVGSSAAGLAALCSASSPRARGLAGASALGTFRSFDVDGAVHHTGRRPAVDPELEAYAANPEDDPAKDENAEVGLYWSRGQSGTVRRSGHVPWGW